MPVHSQYFSRQVAEYIHQVGVENLKKIPKKTSSYIIDIKPLRDILTDIFTMPIDAPWFHVIPSSLRNGKYHAGKALTYITENNSTALKSSIDEGLDCNKKIQIRGFEEALVNIAAQRNKYDCGKYLIRIYF